MSYRKIYCIRCNVENGENVNGHKSRRQNDCHAWKERDSDMRTCWITLATFILILCMFTFMQSVFFPPSFFFFLVFIPSRFPLFTISSENVLFLTVTTFANKFERAMHALSSQHGSMDAISSFYLLKICELVVKNWAIKCVSVCMLNKLAKKCHASSPVLILWTKKCTKCSFKIL